MAEYCSENDRSRMNGEGCTIQLMNEHNSELRSASRMLVEFDNLSYFVRGKKAKSKRILDTVTGCFRPGRLSVIIGPSGAGKTTLFRIISTLKSTNVGGSITVNGKECNADVFRRQTCFLPQEFELLPLLTVKETLYVATRLKVRDASDSGAIYVIVKETAENLGLANCLDTKVENLSGGERKRLSIGIEIVTKPSVLLLDEPTSGLDSASSNQVITLLHKMAKAGCTVACAIHQPSSRMISQFDDLLVIHKGKSFYCGTWNDVIDSLSNAGYSCPQFYNIAEFVLEVVTGERGGDLENLYTTSLDRYVMWKAHSRYSVTGTDSTIVLKKNNLLRKPQISSIWEEQKVLLLRAMICIRRDNTLTKLRFAAHVVIGLLLGVLFYNSGMNASRAQTNIACVFFVLLFLYFSSAMPAVQMFPVEAAVFLREYLNNWYRLKSYYCVKLMSDLPLQILAPTVFISIAYYMSGQPLECNRFFRTWLICVLTTIVGQSSGMLAGVAFNTHVGVFLIPAINMPMILFAGFFLKISEMAWFIQPLCAVSFFRYAFEGILQAIYDGDRERLPCFDIYCPLRSPKIILKSMDMPSVSYDTTVLVLILWIVCLQTSIFGVLKWKAYAVKR